MKKKWCWKKLCNMPGWRLKTAASRSSKKNFFFFFLQMSWFFKNNFVTPTVIDSIPPLLLYCSPSPPQNFSWLQTITKYSEKESKKNPRFVFIKSHVTMILIGILLRRLSQCSQPPPKVVSFYTEWKFECFPVSPIFSWNIFQNQYSQPWNCQNDFFFKL